MTGSADGTGATAGPALITGASAGIGAALAREFARHDHDVVLVARGEDRLRSLADELTRDHGVSAVPIAMDLTDDDAAAALLDRVEAESVEPTVLVNNVGIGVYGRFGDGDLDDERRQIRLNVEVLVELTHRFLEDREEAGILNVGSVAGFVPGPYMAGYYASKAYVNSFSQALAAEYHDAPIDVTVVCPGPVATEFHDRAGMDASTVGEWVTYDADRVAREAYAGFQDGETVVVPGLLMNLIVGLTRITPRSIQRVGARIVNRGR